jgi:cytochrome d ubiquinol oxidase subunit I
VSGFAPALAPVDQQYPLEARQMQTLSFVAHIPLVAFAIAFPAMVLFVEWLHMRTGDRCTGSSRAAGRA